MKRGENPSFSLIRKFRRRRAMFRITIGFVLLCVLASYKSGFLQKTIGNFFVSVKIATDTVMNKIANSTQYYVLHFQESYDSEIGKLQQENLKLRLQIKQMEALQIENANLRRIAILKETHSDEVVIAKVSSIFINDFARGGVIDVGEMHGVKTDDIVINENGLVGRIVEVHKNWSKLFFMIDENFSVPVKIGEANALLSGTNSDYLQINLHEDTDIKEGEAVETSGYSSVFREKIPVGIVKKSGGELCVVPYVNFKQLSYVGVLKKHDEK